MVGSVLSPVLGRETDVRVAEAEVPIPMKKVYRRLERPAQPAHGANRNSRALPPRFALCAMARHPHARNSVDR